MHDSRVKAETRLKAAVVDRLIAGNHVDPDAVLISEMSIANWTRRADVVLANGHLWAFEIKSEADSLQRLAGQIDDFGRYFERLTIVVAAKFEERVAHMLPQGVGLWVVGGDGKIIERARAKTCRLTKEASITLMTATELRRLLACNGVREIEAAPRAVLERAAFDLPASDLSAAARDAVKRRFRSRHRDFIARKASEGTIDAMTALGSGRKQRDHREPATHWPAVELEAIMIDAKNPMLVAAPAGATLRRRA